MLVTGGGSGIGAAIVTAFAGQGAKVAFIDIDVQASEKLVQTLAQSKHRPLFIPCDLTNIRRASRCGRPSRKARSGRSRC